MLFALLVAVFRDPRRQIPAAPLGVVSPVNGVVVDVGVTDNGVLNGEASRILIRVATVGDYTARSPIEGKIMDLNGVPAERTQASDQNVLWIRSDEDDDVVVLFRGHRFGLVPHAFLGYGERVGQGQRCAYLRLTRLAELQMPKATRALARTGQRVLAGTDVLAKLPQR